MFVYLASISGRLCLVVTSNTRCSVNTSVYSVRISLYLVCIWLYSAIVPLYFVLTLWYSVFTRWCEAVATIYLVNSSLQTCSVLYVLYSVLISRYKACFTLSYLVLKGDIQLRKNFSEEFFSKEFQRLRSLSLKILWIKLWSFS